MYIRIEENNDGGVLQIPGSGAVALAEENREGILCTADSKTRCRNLFHLLFSVHRDNMLYILQHIYTRHLRSGINNAKSYFLGYVLPTMLKTNTNKLWSVINPSHDENISQEDSSGHHIPIEQCASALNDTFTKSFSASHSNRLSPTHQYDFVVLPVIVDIDGVVKLIDSLSQPSPFTRL